MGTINTHSTDMWRHKHLENELFYSIEKQGIPQRIHEFILLRIHEFMKLEPQRRTILGDISLQVNLKEMCTNRPPDLMTASEHPHFQPRSLTKEFSITTVNDPLVRHQYFTDENGLQTVFPATRQSTCHYSELRLR